MELIDDELRIINETKGFLNAFLKEMKGFHPFAMIMDNEGIIYSLEHEIKDEYPDPNMLIDLYERTFRNEIKETESEYKLGIICIDVFIHEQINGIDTKRDAIEMRLVGATYRKKAVLFYKITEVNEVIFQELVGGDSSN
ncbi:hypothetical protein [Viscerimonas tarda]